MHVFSFVNKNPCKIYSAKKKQIPIRREKNDFDAKFVKITLSLHVLLLCCCCYCCNVKLAPFFYRHFVRERNNNANFHWNARISSNNTNNSTNNNNEKKNERTKINVYTKLNLPYVCWVHSMGFICSPQIEWRDFVQQTTRAQAPHHIMPNTMKTPNDFVKLSSLLALSLVKMSKKSACLL